MNLYTSYFQKREAFGILFIVYSTNNMEKFKLVIFDLDGTLGDTIPLCIQAFHEALEPIIHRKLTDKEIEDTFGPAEAATIKAFAPDHIPDGLEAFHKAYKKLHDMCPAPFPGIRELLDNLKKHQVHIALVTGKGKESTDITLNKFEIASYFEFIENGSPNAEIKPSGIQAIFDKLPDVAKKNILYVGDSPGDIKASRKAHVTVAAAAWASTAKPEELRKLEPDEIFYTVNDFAVWLQKCI